MSAFGQQSLYQLPEIYGETRITLMPVDHHLLYTYWEISDEKLRSFKEKFGIKLFESSIPALKITNISKNTSFLIQLNEFSTSWYINVPDSGCVYMAEIGRKFSDDFFISFASSNHVLMPNVNISLNTAAYFVNCKDILKVMKEYSHTENMAMYAYINDIASEMEKTLSSYGIYFNES